MPGRHRKPPQRRRTGRHRKPTEHTRWAVPAVAAVASVGVGGVATASALTGVTDQATATPARSPAVATARPTPSAAPTRRAALHVTPPSVTRVAVVRIRRPVVVITAVGPVVWLEVTAAGHRLLFEGLLQHGRTLRFTAHPLVVLLGDAGAARVVVRGHARQPAGRPGQVLVLRVR